jgi:hypothetical protein
MNKFNYKKFLIFKFFHDIVNFVFTSCTLW